MNKLYILDSPICTSEHDRFQFIQFAELIKNVVDNGSLPMHIGLLGPWGSGKTSALKMFENISKTDYHVKTISVWKFADDAPSLHRKIVREVERVLDNPKEEGISIETTEQSTGSSGGIFSAITTALDIKNNKDKAHYIMSFLYIFLTAFLSVFAISYQNTTATFLAIIPLLLFSSQYHQRSTQMTTKTLALQHNDQYEARFEKAVNEYLYQKKGKLVLIFDDLDRLPPTQIVAALNTIKTFLSSSSCIFIIPCDETVLRQGISTVLKEKIKNDGNAEVNTGLLVSEFLNKTFDIILRLPAIEQANMRRYAKHLLEVNSIEWANDDRISVDRVLSNLIHTGVKTPRQVKNLLNAFSFDWLLACKRDKEVGKHHLTKDSIAISIFTVLRTDFAEFFSLLNQEPFLIQDEEKYSNFINKEGFLLNTDKAQLLAYLSRVSHSISNDPRDFVYFSNHKLNPTTGRPAIGKTLEYLVNAQEKEFDKAFTDLSDGEKIDALSAFLVNVELNASIEAENCLRVLASNEQVLKYIKIIDYDEWNKVLRENIKLLHDYSIEDGCNVIYKLGDDKATWDLFRNETLSVKEQYIEMFDLWKGYPVYADRLELSKMANDFIDAYIDGGDGYQLASELQKLEPEHDIINIIEWLKVLKLTVISEKESPFKFKEWLVEYINKCKSDVTCEYVTDLISNYNPKYKAGIKDIGKLWCEIYVDQGENDSNLERILKYFKTGFTGFNWGDLDVVGKNIVDSKNANIHELAVEVISHYWNQKTGAQLAKAWSRCPGVAEYCSKNLDFTSPMENITLIADCLVNIDDKITNDGQLADRLNTEIINAHNQNRATQAVDIVILLSTSVYWNEKFKSYINDWFPKESPHIWLTWYEIVVRDKIKLFTGVCLADVNMQQWILSGCECMISAIRRMGHTGYPYSGQASVYINIVAPMLIEEKYNSNWDDMVNFLIKNNVLDYLDVTNQNNILIRLIDNVRLDNDSFNKLLLTYSTNRSIQHQGAIINRWEHLTQNDRKQYIEKIAPEEDTLQQFFELLIDWIQVNPLPSFIDEQTAWQLNENQKEEICKKIVVNANLNILNKWISKALNEININGVDKWIVFAMNYAIKSRNDIIISESALLDTALGLHGERSKIALEYLVKTSMAKKEANKFKDKVQDLAGEFPDLVEEFRKKHSYRFKKILKGLIEKIG